MSGKRKGWMKWVLLVLLLAAAGGIARLGMLEPTMTPAAVERTVAPENFTPQG